MTAAEDQRQHAAECLRLAQQTQDTNAKALLLKMADAWLKLAQETETRQKKLFWITEYISTF
jgi:hypothetical protein